jgi:hypothetical protein
MKRKASAITESAEATVEDDIAVTAPASKRNTRKTRKPAMEDPSPVPDVAAVPKRRSGHSQSATLNAEEADSKRLGKETKSSQEVQPAKRVPKKGSGGAKLSAEKSTSSKRASSPGGVLSASAVGTIPTTPQSSLSRRVREPQSLDQWTVLSPSSQASSMMDQLESSTVEDMLSQGLPNAFTNLRGGDDGVDVSTAKEDHPFPTQSQALSRSQPNVHAQSQESQTFGTISNLLRSSGNDRTPRRRPSSVRPAPYRRLTDIASEKSLFESDLTPTASQPEKVTDFKWAADDDSEDEDDSGTSSDAGRKSHIPKSRVAGSTVRKNRRGLLSFA